MLYWIKRIAFLMGTIAFFIILFVGLDPDDPFAAGSVLAAFSRALLGGAMFWFVGIIIADIVLKGIVEDIEQEHIPEYEGGLLQRVGDAHKGLLPQPSPANDSGEKKEKTGKKAGKK
jgi:hypothetical protein